MVLVGGLQPKDTPYSSALSRNRFKQLGSSYTDDESLQVGCEIISAPATADVLLVAHRAHIYMMHHGYGRERNEWHTGEEVVASVAHSVE